MRRQIATLVTGFGIVGALVLAAGIFSATGTLVKSLLLLVGISLLLLSFWLLRIGLRPHPYMLRHSVVRLSPTQLRRLARAGEPIDLPLGRSKSVIVTLRPVRVTHETAEIIVSRRGEEPERVRAGEDPTFAGEVAGQKGSVVRLTITDDWISGYVRTESDWWFIEPLRTFRLDAGFDEYIVYRTKDLRFKLPYGDDFKPRKVEQRGGGLDPPHRVNPLVGICMVHDEQYSAACNGDPYTEQRALINDINGIYSQVGAEFQIRVFIWTVNWLTSTNADVMLNQVEDAVKSIWTDLRQVANRQAFGTEVAHATTGKKLDGGALGIAWQPGVYSLTQQFGTIWRQIWYGWLWPGLRFQNMMVAAHELGHNFNGAHEEADQWCVSWFLWWCIGTNQTIMWPVFGNGAVSRFSAGDRVPSHNNMQRISNNMTTGRNVNF